MAGILGCAVLLGAVAAGSWLLSPHIQGLDAVSETIVRDAEAQAGYEVFVPEVPEGFTRTGGIRVDPPEVAGTTNRVVQAWESRTLDGIYFVLTQGPEQYHPPGGEPFMIGKVMGERLAIPAKKPPVQGALMFSWRQDDLTYTIYGVTERHAEAVMLEIAAFLQSQR